MNARSLLSVVVASAASALPGCSDRCADGYELVNHLCAAEAGAEGGMGGAPDAPPGGAGADDAGADGGLACESTFNAECLTSAECTCDASFCAGYPGQVGFCTRTGCTTDPGVCPPDWGCTSLAGFGLPATSICTPPA